MEAVVIKFYLKNRTHFHPYLVIGKNYFDYLGDRQNVTALKHFAQVSTLPCTSLKLSKS